MTRDNIQNINLNVGASRLNSNFLNEQATGFVFLNNRRSLFYELNDYPNDEFYKDTFIEAAAAG